MTDFWVEKKKNPDGTILIEPLTWENRDKDYPNDPRMVFLVAAWEIVEYPKEGDNNG